MALNPTALRIALRYLFSPKSHSAVNVISAVAVAGVAVATAAIIVVLSVFNGFHSLIASRLSLLDPPLQVTAVQGKTVASADSLGAALEALPAIAAAEPVVTERALAMMGTLRQPVRLKGVRPEGYARVASLDSTVVAGEAWADFYPGVPSATLSVGVANALRAPVGSEELMGLYVPRRQGRINPANPMAAFRTDSLAVSAVFSVNQPEYDVDMVYVPLSVARSLLSYTTEATAIEAVPAPGVDTDRAAEALRQALGPDYRVLTRLELQAEAFRIVNVEKWTAFMLLVFILAIASFNVLSTMSLMIVEKHDNNVTLRALGADRGLLARIYGLQGWMVTCAGAVAGAVAGVLLCLAQQRWGLVKLAADTSQLSIAAYPVEFHAADLIPVAAIVAVVGLAAALFSARRAA